MAKLDVTYKVKGADEIKKVTDALIALDKALINLKKKGIRLNIIVNGKETKRM